MSRNDKKTAVRSFGELKQLNPKVTGRKLKVPGALSFGADVTPPSPDEVRSVVTTTSTSVEAVVEAVKQFTDEHFQFGTEQFRLVRPSFDALGDHIARYIEELTDNGLTEEADRVCFAFAKAMTDHWPAGSRKLNLIADLGLRVGFLRKAPQDQKKDVIFLPLTNPKGSWTRTAFLSKIRGANSIFAKLSLEQAKLDEEQRVKRTDELEKLKEQTTGEPLDVLKSGEGKALIYCPTWEDKAGNVHRAGHILFEVIDGYIHPIEAVGAISQLVFFAKKTGRMIQASSINEEEARFDARCNEKRDFYTLLNLWRSMKEGVKKLNKKDDEGDDGLESTNHSDSDGNNGSVMAVAPSES